jgi:hypothetical protein
MASVVMTAWTIRLVARDQTRGWVSDEVSQQNILMAWQNGLSAGATVGPDNFYLRYPLYFLVNNLPLSPLNALRATSWTLLAVVSVAAAVALSCTPAASASQLRRRLALAVGCGVLIGLPQSYFDFLAFPNSRNLQVAGMFLLAAAALLHMRTSNRDTKWPSGRIVGGIVLIALLFADDPLTALQVTVPFALLISFQWLRERPLRTTTYTALGVVLAAMLLGEAVRGLLGLLLPIDYVRIPTQVVTLDQFGGHLQGFVVHAAGLFGLDPWGQPLLSTSVLLCILRLLPLVLGAQVLSSSHAGEPREFLHLLALGAVVNLLLVAALPQGAGDPGLARFYLPLIVALTLGATLLVSQMPSQRTSLAIAGCYVLAAVLVVGAAARVALDGTGSRANARDAAVLEAARGTDTSKGYGDYSLSSITTFLGDGRLPVIGVLCGTAAEASGRLGYFDVLQERSLLAEPAEQSFYLYREDSPCTADVLMAQLGTPTADSAVAGAPGVRVATYPFDLAQRIDK